jgi:hypothetical protein
MPYIIREDGEHFVIPSYRDVLSAKQKNALKRDILLLSQSYGEYITLQRQSTIQYEVAFSPDTGYLLGESIWHQLKRPMDMVYCEAIPNTSEAILVIVKSGSVYLDGSFPLDSIPEELVIFLTQQNNFEIYIYGNVPISEKPTEGKFSFEATSVKSFTVLDKPLFPTLPLLKIYQLQPVEQVLRAHGIGVFPTRQILLGIIGLLCVWMAWSYFTRESAAPTPEKQAEANPYLIYNTTLNSPAPDQQINAIVKKLSLFATLPGWQLKSITFGSGNLATVVTSNGGTIKNLFAWAEQHAASVEIKQDGVYVNMLVRESDRPVPQQIYPLKQVLGSLVDNVAAVYPGNHLRLDQFTNRGVFTEVTVTISVDKISPSILAVIAQQLKDLPLSLQSLEMSVEDGSLTGSIIVDALGS